MTFGIVGNTAKPVIHVVTKTLLSYLKSKNLPFVVHEALARWLNEANGTVTIEPRQTISEKELPMRCDVIIALGGDGTMLCAARMVGHHGIPILGVNLGKLGFLAEVSVDEMQGCIDRIIEDDVSVEERMVLKATTPNDSTTYHGLNEVVVDKGASPRVIDLETYVNDEYLVTFAADGIIVTTPTGSTAYSLASGGPIVVPQSDVITINPIAPHTLTARPVVVPDESIIRVVVSTGSKPVHVTADGQTEGFYDTPAEFTIQKAPYKVKLIKMKGRSYYDLLRAKLMWGRDVRVGSKS